MSKLQAIFVAFAVVFFADAAAAQTPDTVLIERMTWPEIRAAIDAGKTTIIVPTGGTEQNGPHMALGKHNVRVASNADAIARRLGNALVAPVVVFTPEGNIDPPSGHMRFAGTISLPDPVFAQLLEYIARSLKQHGFRDIVFIGDSGPNQKPQEDVAKKLNAEWARTNTRVHAITGYYRADAAGEQAEMVKRGVKPEEIGNHAEVRDTSELLAVDPTMVRMNKLEKGTPQNGVQGDPRHATAEIGRVLNERNIVRTVDLIKKAIAAR
jgi:creatinine amidohydrolase/Fe(II)-dependent formamide hydrolase-like protein